MTTRMRHETVTFRNPFRLSGIEGIQPPGSYTVETEDETIESLSFLAYRRVQTVILLPLHPGAKGSFEAVTLESGDLERSLATDRESSAVSGMI